MAHLASQEMVTSPTSHPGELSWQVCAQFFNFLGVSPFEASLGCQPPLFLSAKGDQSVPFMSSIVEGSMGGAAPH